MARTATRPRMDATEARSFHGISETSVLQVITAIECRKTDGTHLDCSCSPYEDVFTFNRWKALGASVRKGEKALRIHSWVPIGSTPSNDPEKEAKPRLKPHTMFLFCACQVDRK